MKCIKCLGYSVFDDSSVVEGWRCFNCGKRVFCREKQLSFTAMDLFMRKPTPEPATIVKSKESKERRPMDLFRPCLGCKKEFQCYARNQKYCMPVCRTLLKLALKEALNPGINKTCPICHIDFLPAHKSVLYCSNKCLYRANYNAKKLKRELYEKMHRGNDTTVQTD